MSGIPTINAFIYSNCQLLNLNTMIAANSGWILTKALAINNAGQIVGVGQFNGQTRAFLLSPSGPAGANTDPTSTYLHKSEYLILGAEGNTTAFFHSNGAAFSL